MKRKPKKQWSRKPGANEIPVASPVENPVWVPSVQDDDEDYPPQDLQPEYVRPKANLSVEKVAARVAAAARLEKVEREKADITKKQIVQTEKEIKNSQKLAKSLDELIKVLKVDPNKDGKPNQPNILGQKIADQKKDKGVGGTVKDAAKDAILQKFLPVKDLTTKKGLLGIAAAKTSENSIIGSIFSALSERENVNQQKRLEKENFHTGFTNGTEAGRQMIEKNKARHLEAVRKSDPSLSPEQVEKKAAKLADEDSRKSTSIIFDKKKDLENQRDELLQKRKNLKTYGEHFDLSDEEEQKLERIQKSHKGLVSSGYDISTESDDEIKKRLANSAVMETAKALPADSPLTAESAKDVFDGAMEELNKLGQAQLSTLRIIADLTREQSKDDKKEDQEQDKKEDKEKTKTPPVKKEGKSYLEKGRELLSKGKGAVADKATGAIKSKITSGLGSRALSAASSLLTSPAAGVGLAGAVGLGVGSLINKGVEAFTSDSIGGHLHTLINGEYDPNKSNDLDDAKKVLKTDDMALSERQAAALKKEGIEIPKGRKVMEAPKPIAPPAPKPEKVHVDTKPKIDSKLNEISMAREAKAKVAAAPVVSAPVINNNTSNTTVVRPPIRNQEPSFNRTLRDNFI